MLFFIRSVFSLPVKKALRIKFEDCVEIYISLFMPA